MSKEQKEVADALNASFAAGYTMGYQEGYRAGFNEHARSRAKGEAMFGRYEKAKPLSESDPLPHSPAGPWPALEEWNQHGQGENP